MPLAERKAKAVGPKCDIGERKNAVVGLLEPKIVRDALHLQVRRRTVHNTEETGIFFKLLGSGLYQPSFTKFF
jgi:hypothetical protein